MKRLLSNPSNFLFQRPVVLLAPPPVQQASSGCPEVVEVVVNSWGIRSEGYVLSVGLL